MAESPKLAASVADAEKRRSSEAGEAFIAYNVVVKGDGSHDMYPQREYSVWRRFKDFTWLRAHLELTYQDVVLPPLPAKRGVFSAQKILDNFGPEFIDKRRAALERFVKRVATHPRLSIDAEVAGFFKMETLDRGKQSKLKIQERVTRAAVALKLRYQDVRFVNVSSYADNLGHNLQNIIKAHEKATRCSLDIYHEIGNLAPIFSVWSVAEQSFGDVLQTSGHFMDNVSLSVNERVDAEEENFIAPVQEYMTFAECLRALVRRQEERQYQQEKDEDALHKKQTELETLEKPSSERGMFSSFSTKLFGDYTPEQKAKKKEELQAAIAECTQNHTASVAENDRFSEACLSELALFNRQKDADFKAFLRAYVKAQIVFCRKSLSAWQNLRAIYDQMN